MKFPSTVPGDHALILRAAALAAVAHGEQKRKYTGRPYIEHPLRVAAAVAGRTMNPHVIAAAVLHDALEDTALEAVEIRASLGNLIADLVLELTDNFTPQAYPNWNRARRKTAEVARYATVSAEAQLIKAYDLIDNAADIGENDPGFARVYLPELRAAALSLGKIDAHVLIDLNQVHAELDRSSQ